MKNSTLRISNKVEEISKLADFVDKLAEEWDIPAGIKMKLNLVLEEVLSNIIFYGFDDDAEHFITVEAFRLDNALKLIVTDDGKPFNILQAQPFADEGKTAEEREIGGLGIHFVMTIMDDLKYHRTDNKNVLTMFKTYN